MAQMHFNEALEQVIDRDGRYHSDAYHFLRAALDFTMKEAEKDRHVSGMELLDGFRRLALNEFGPMAVAVLDDWGVRETRDVGEMVFNLIEAGVFGKSDEDELKDFEGVFGFGDAFVEPFRPTGLRGGGSPDGAGRGVGNGSAGRGERRAEPNGDCGGEPGASSSTGS